MKSIFTVIFVCSLILNSYSQNTSSWDILNDGKGYLGNIDFVSDGAGFMVSNGCLLKTVDGGDTWNFVSQISDWGAFYIDFTSKYNGWALSQPNWELYQILKTTDGGHTWQVKKESTDFKYRSMQVVTDSIVCAWDTYDGIIRTTNGGKNWTDITPDINDLFFNSIWFTAPDTGFVACSASDTAAILKTIDGGNNWTEIRMPGFRHLDHLKFFNGSKAYVLAEYGRYFIASNDTFETWTICDFDTAIIYSYALLDENTIFAVKLNHRVYGLEYPVDGGMMYSTDVGLTWSTIETPDVGSPKEIYSNSKKDLFVISPCAGSGWAGIPVSNLWKSSDLGNNWQILIFSYPLTDVFFTDKQKGLLSYGWSYRCGEMCFGSKGGLFTTNDGGISWEKMLELNNVNYKCFFINKATGYLLGGNRILKSIDYGENWLDVYINNPDSQDYSFDGFDLDFLNNELGWVVGEFHSAGWDTNGACILETSDGGENWRRVWDNGITEWNNYCLNSITVSDSTAWAVGNHGLIVKYTLKDKWQLQTSVTGLQLNKVFFSYEQHGWIAGGSYYWGEEFQSILLKTVDGGKSWKEKQFEKEIIHDMYFADSLHGWAVGEDTTQSYLRHNSGIILESFDGGENWMPVVENLSAPLKSIHFKDGYGWAVGDNGLILRTEGFTWIDQASKDQFPLKFSLSQNYPNPFNPSTIIEFTLPKSEFVTLKIFNILGEEVVTLVNKKLQAGNHTYQFDGSKFASGIYMYMIEAGEYQQVRKMILLK